MEPMETTLSTPLDAGLEIDPYSRLIGLIPNRIIDAGFDFEILI